MWTFACGGQTEVDRGTLPDGGDGNTGVTRVAPDAMADTRSPSPCSHNLECTLPSAASCSSCPDGLFACPQVACVDHGCQTVAQACLLESLASFKSVLVDCKSGPPYTLVLGGVLSFRNGGTQPVRISANPAIGRIVDAQGNLAATARLLSFDLTLSGGQESATYLDASGPGTLWPGGNVTTVPTGDGFTLEVPFTVSDSAGNVLFQSMATSTSSKMLCY